MRPARVVAIDGPAASGKSTTAGAVAAVLGLRHIDSGAWYRAVTWLAQRGGVVAAADICSAADAAQLELVLSEGSLVLRANGRDIESELRSAEVTAGVSVVSALAPVREWINRRLRVAVGMFGGGVVDGRDIGTVVFPDAALKIFLVATAESRARRRLLQRGGALDPAELVRETARLEERDRLDSGRRVAPLRAAADAVEIDTTQLQFNGQVAQIVVLAKARGLLEG